ncbi:unnamed protein product [Ectocarpus sp. 12 AP-2014]
MLLQKTRVGRIFPHVGSVGSGCGFPPGLAIAGAFTACSHCMQMSPHISGLWSWTRIYTKFRGRLSQVRLTSLRYKSSALAACLHSTHILPNILTIKRLDRYSGEAWSLGRL